MARRGTLATTRTRTSVRARPFLYFSADEVEAVTMDRQEDGRRGRHHSSSGTTPSASRYSAARRPAGCRQGEGRRFLDIAACTWYTRCSTAATCSSFVDAAQRGLRAGPPFTVLEVRRAGGYGSPSGVRTRWPRPDQVFAMSTRWGAAPGRIIVVACEPADVVVSAGMGLSEPVREALPARGPRSGEESLKQVQRKEGADSDCPRLIRYGRRLGSWQWWSRDTAESSATWKISQSSGDAG